MLRIIMVTSVLMAGGLFASVSHGADAAPAVDYQQRYQICLQQQALQNNGALAFCADGISGQANAEIDRLYQHIYTKLHALNATDAEQFSQSQHAWTQYRNSHCELAGSYIGSPQYAYCPMALNIARVAELREFMLSEQPPAH